MERLNQLVFIQVAVIIRPHGESECNRKKDINRNLSLVILSTLSIFFVYKLALKFMNVVVCSTFYVPVTRVRNKKLSQQHTKIIGMIFCHFFPTPNIECVLDIEHSRPCLKSFVTPIQQFFFLSFDRVPSRIMNAIVCASIH